MSDKDKPKFKIILEIVRGTFSIIRMALYHLL